MLSFKKNDEKSTIIGVLKIKNKNTHELVYYDSMALTTNYLINDKEDYEFLPFYINKDRIIHYIFGRSGSGKSYLSKKLSKMYSKLLNVYIISPIKDNEYTGTFLEIDDILHKTNDYEEDKTYYDELKIKFKYFKNNKKIDKNTLKDLELEILKLKPNNKNNFKNNLKTNEKYDELIEKPSLFIYDDNESTSNADKNKLMYIMNKQLITGRHNNINMIIMNHQSNNGMETRNIINESNLFTFFNYNRYVHYFLKNYLLYDDEFIKQIIKLLKYSRFITINKDLNIILCEKVIIKI